MNLHKFQRFHIQTQLHFKTSLEIYACDWITTFSEQQYSCNRSKLHSAQHFLTYTCKLILRFLCLPAPIIHELGLGDKEIENQPRLKNFNLDLILTCNIAKRLYLQCLLAVGQDFFPYGSHLTIASLVATVLWEPFS